MPRKPNEKGSRPIKNKSGIVTHQEETILNTAYSFEQEYKFREKYKPQFKGGIK